MTFRRAGVTTIVALAASSLGPSVGHASGTDTFTLVLDRGVSEMELRARVQAMGGALIHWVPKIRVASVRGVTRARALRWPRVLRVAREGSLSVPRVAPAHGAPPALPSPLWQLQWDMRMVRAGEAIAAGNTGGGTTVAVLDTGIFYAHPDLEDNYAGGTNFFAAYCDSAQPTFPHVCDSRDPLDENGHGTAVAGIIAAGGGPTGVTGVAPDAKLLAVRVCGPQGTCPDVAVAAGIVYAADAGAEVANMSINANVGLDTPELIASERALRYAARRGTTVVTIAGNQGWNWDERSDVPIVGNDDSAIMVSSVGPDAERAVKDHGAPYSNIGSEVDLAAPGGNLVYATDLEFPLARDFTQMVFNTWSPLSSFVPALPYLWNPGTSMAAPHVSGAAALVVARYGRSRPSHVRRRLLRTAADRGAPGRDPVFGHGLLDVTAAVR